MKGPLMFALDGDWFFNMLIHEMVKQTDGGVIQKVMDEDAETTRRLEEAKVVM